MEAPYDAVIVVSFGGPERPEDVIPFLENVVRGKNVPQARMLEVAVDGLDRAARLGGAVLHGNAPEEAARVAEQYKELYGPMEFMMSEVTPIIGVHSGPGVIGVVSYNL